MNRPSKNIFLERNHGFSKNARNSFPSNRYHPGTWYSLSALFKSNTTPGYLSSYPGIVHQAKKVGESQWTTGKAHPALTSPEQPAVKTSHLHEPSSTKFLSFKIETDKKIILGKSEKGPPGLSPTDPW